MSEGSHVLRARVCGGDRHAEAIAVRDGRISAVGDLEQVTATAGPAARVVDLDGAVVLPGLIDTHPHLLHYAAMGAGKVDLADAVDHADIVGRIRRAADLTEAGEWIVATPVGEPHYFQRRSFRDLREGVLPDAGTLDRATSGHPVLIQAWPPAQPNVSAL